MKEDRVHIVNPEQIDPDILIPQLLTFFAKLINAKQELDTALFTKEVNVMLDAITTGFAKILASSGVIPKDILDNLEDLHVTTGSLKPNEDCSTADECSADKIFH